jgi:hypothetical protein
MNGKYYSQEPQATISEIEIPRQLSDMSYSIGNLRDALTTLTERLKSVMQDEVPMVTECNPNRVLGGDAPDPPASPMATQLRRFVRDINFMHNTVMDVLKRLEV